MCIMSATCPTHLTLLYFISVIVFVEEYAIEFVLCPAAQHSACLRCQSVCLFPKFRVRETKFQTQVTQAKV